MFHELAARSDAYSVYSKEDKIDHNTPLQTPAGEIIVVCVQRAPLNAETSLGARREYGQICSPGAAGILL